MANKKQIFNINVKKISAGYKFVAQNVAFSKIMTMDDAAADEIVNLWASNSRTRENLENPDVNYYAVSSVNKSGANNVSDGCYYTLILAKNDRTHNSIVNHLYFCRLSLKALFPFEYFFIDCIFSSLYYNPSLARFERLAFTGEFI